MGLKYLPQQANTSGTTSPIKNENKDKKTAPPLSEVEVTYGAQDIIK